LNNHQHIYFYARAYLKTMFPLYSTPSTTGKPPGMVLTDTVYFLDSTCARSKPMGCPWEAVLLKKIPEDLSRET
jgi:hypothetical protein